MIEIIFKIIIMIIFVIIFITSIYLLKEKKKVEKMLKEKPIKEYYKELKSSDSYFPIQKISPNLITVIIALEDCNFYSHPGYDVKKILQAICSNIFSLRIVAGGSSITQQLAKNMYFTFEKKISRKIEEFFVTLELEKQLTKKEILDIYLNIIDYGAGHKKNGIKKTCEVYYHDTPDNLSLNQAITLGSILPAPSYYSPLYKGEKYYFPRVRYSCLLCLAKRGVIEEDEIELYSKANYDDKEIIKK